MQRKKNQPLPHESIFSSYFYFEFHLISKKAHWKRDLLILCFFLDQSASDFFFQISISKSNSW